MRRATNVQCAVSDYLGLSLIMNFRYQVFKMISKRAIFVPSLLLREFPTKTFGGSVACLVASLTACNVQLIFSIKTSEDSKVVRNWGCN